MSVPRVKSGSWGVGEKLTSSQMNQVDTNITYVLDKRSGQTDTLESVVSAAGAGRIVPTVEVGADADTTYTVADGIRVIRIPTTLTANRTYALSDTGAIDGDTVHVFMETPNTRRVRINDAGGNAIAILGAPTVATSVDGYEASFVWKTGVGWQRAKGRPRTLAIEAFTATGTWTCPRGVESVLVHLWGGGAGGGGGATSNTATNTYFCGGGGGGGALPALVPVATTPGQTYDVTIGGGGAAGGAGLVGSPGTPTKFSLSGTDLAVGPGAEAGQAATTTSAGTTTTTWARGGQPVASPPRIGWGISTDITITDASPGPTSFSLYQVPGQGGYGSSKSAASAGASLPGYPFAGGTAGSLGTNVGAQREGGGGGGGGAGPGGNGGAGGNGGNAAAPGSGTAGAAGGAAGANTGAGGGGGGGGGTGSVSGASGGAGGAGGSGKLFLIYVIQGA